MEIKAIKQVSLTESISDLGSRHFYFLPGEIAEVEHAKYKVVKEQDITTPSPDRVKVICPIFYECGGCDFLHINYQKQLQMKEEYVSNLYKKDRIPSKINSIAQSKQPKNYRHKVVLSATQIKEKLRLGLYRENSKTVIPYLDCHIQDQEINQLLKTVEKVLNDFKIPAYHIDREKGIIKHVMVRKSYATKDFMLIFVTHDYLLPNAKKIIQEIIAKYPKVVTVIQNIHKKKTHLVLLDEEKILYGPGYIEDEMDGIKFKLSSKSFYQVNPVQMIELYHKALELAQIKSTDIVMDTYSGVGTISLLAAKKAKHVIAIEANPNAHRDAVTNKKMNQISNITFIQSPVEDYIKNYQEKIDCLIMDPTRDGATKAFLDAILRLKPKRIVYISCEPTTQVRDVKSLLTHYNVEVVQPVDMFSQTIHVESITLLSLKTS
jgi:23S rRNA (uracil1939-C5)-methyltransferase